MLFNVKFYTRLPVLSGPRSKKNHEYKKFQIWFLFLRTICPLPHSPSLCI